MIEDNIRLKEVDMILVRIIELWKRLILLLSLRFKIHSPSSH